LIGALRANGVDVVVLNDTPPLFAAASSSKAGRSTARTRTPTGTSGGTRSFARPISSRSSRACAP
jgi:hypothetical protein